MESKRVTPIPPQAAHDVAHPVARVMVEVPTVLFNEPFDYRVPPALDHAAQPGVRVYVRLGSSAVTGIVWARSDHPANGRALSDLKPIDDVVSPTVFVPADLRRDLEEIARQSGGTVSQLLRLAIPDAHPGIERRPGWQQLIHGGIDKQHTGEPQSGELQSGEKTDEQPIVEVHSAPSASYLERISSHMKADYTSPDSFLSSQQSVWDVLPGPERWARDAAWCVATALAHGQRALVELPDSRHVTNLLEQLKEYGLTRLVLPTKKAIAEQKRRVKAVEKAAENDANEQTSESPRPLKTLEGTVAVISSDDTPSERTIGFCAAANGAADVVIGTRAAMYAPMPPHSVFIVVDDDAYQNWDGFMPYAGVREVLQLRAQCAHGHYIAMSVMRSATSHFAVQHHEMNAVTPRREALDRFLPKMAWLTRDELLRRADPAYRSRIPHTVVQALRKGLEKGPALVVPGSHSTFSLFICAQCGHQARCTRCTGPLAWAGAGMPPVCAWCGNRANEWTCPRCGNHKLRIGRFSLGDTADQLRALLPSAPFIVRQKVDPAKMQRGTKQFVPQIPNEPCVVVAAPQSVPQVRANDDAISGYQAVVILDAWMADYAQRLDGQSDMLATWFSLAGQTVPASQGGVALLVGDCPQNMGQAWQKWSPMIFADQLVASRQEAGLPPTVCAASVWGRPSLVGQLLSRIGVLDGDMAQLPISESAGNEADQTAETVEPSGKSDRENQHKSVASVLGPLPIRPQETQRRSPTFSGAGDRVRAVVRVPLSRAGELAYRLRTVAANMEREGRKGELRYWMYPKDLRER